MTPHPAGGLALIGYRGTGKSTVGRILAGRLGRPFADTDAWIEATYSRPISAIFAEEGEEAFRAIEALAARKIFDFYPGAVVATGGGIVLRADNRRMLRDFGFVAWLTAEPATLADRLAADSAKRPALTAAGTLGEIADVLAGRTPLYRETAHAWVATDGLSPGEVAERVLGCWELAGGGER